MKNLINRFFAFANISYTMFTVRSNVKDGRKSPQIKPSAIFLSLILMVLFKKRSLLKFSRSKSHWMMTNGLGMCYSSHREKDCRYFLSTRKESVLWLL